MPPAHFYDVDGDLSDNNVGKILGMSEICDNDPLKE